MILLFVVYIFLIVSASGFDPKQHKNWNLLPHDKCGSVWRNRIIGGHEAAMNSYPWIALIGYENKRTKNISFQCGGVLVTTKVVLTAGHCIYSSTGRLKMLVSYSNQTTNKTLISRTIRLGEHDINTDPDCNDDYCADPIIDAAPSEIIVPKTFKFEAYQHDIALVRLRNEIKFTSFVKPICLSDSLPENLVGSITEVAGWGIYDIRIREGSSKLLVIEKTVVNLKECVKRYGHSVKIGPEQICAGGEIGKDSCGGDSGGPLMKVETGPRGPRYYLLGIVSFGSQRCGRSNAPAVYTKMFSHLEWFLNNLEKTSDDSMIIY